MGYQECSVGREVKVDMKSLREQKRLEAEGRSSDTVCMVLLTFFFGCKLATEEGRSRKPHEDLPTAIRRAMSSRTLSSLPPT